MKTHTLRKSKTPGRKILTFTPGFVETIVEAHPWAARAFIGCVLKETNASLDMDQQLLLTERIKPIPTTSYEQHTILHWLQQGIRVLDTTLPVLLSTLDFAAKRIFDEN
jgi:hypothetical protein